MTARIHSLSINTPLSLIIGVSLAYIYYDLRLNITIIGMGLTAQK